MSGWLQTLTDCRTWAKSDRAKVAHASSPRKEQEQRERDEWREAKAIRKACGGRFGDIETLAIAEGRAAASAGVW